MTRIRARHLEAGVYMEMEYKVEKLNDEIRTLALSSGADLVGFTGTEKLEEGSPKGHRPSDLLFPDARTIIVLACGRQLNEDRNYYYNWGPHFALTFISLKEEVNWLRMQARKSIEQVENFLKNKGFKVAVETHGWTGTLSFRMAAYLAGLGVFGKGNFLIHPKHGPLNILACIATNAPLKHDHPLNLNLCGECVECIKACKYGAFKRKGNRYIWNAKKCRVYDRIVNPVTEKWTYGPCNSKCANACPIGKSPEK